MLKALKKLYEVRLITPAGLYKLFSSVFYSGINVMALLRFAAKQYGKNIAIVDEYGELSYEDLYRQTEQLAIILQEQYHKVPRQKIAIICRNHASLVRSVFSAAQTGADIYLLNVEMNGNQFNELVSRHNFNLIIYDPDVPYLIEQSSFKQQAIPAYHPVLPSIESMAKSGTTPLKKIRSISSGKIIVLTGGTTGDFKIA